MVYGYEWAKAPSVVTAEVFGGWRFLLLFFCVLLLIEPGFRTILSTLFVANCLATKAAVVTASELVV